MMSGIIGSVLHSWIFDDLGFALKCFSDISYRFHQSSKQRTTVLALNSIRCNCFTHATVKLAFVAICNEVDMHYFIVHRWNQQHRKKISVKLYWRFLPGFRVKPWNIYETHSDLTWRFSSNLKTCASTFFSREF